MALYGYGKLLDVDLATKQIAQRDITAEFAREYLGGMGFGCRIIYDEVGPDVDPLGPENIIVFANGPLTGTQAPCSGRVEITTKSPLTGSIGTGNTGGLWGARLKHAGFDLLIVRNKAKEPLYLWIDDDKVELRDATHLWGKETQLTSDLIDQELGGPTSSAISVLAIGPAGENLVRFACPLNDYHHTAARAGAGAVMGAKRLKAIAVRGTRAVNIASPEAFQKATREARELFIASGMAGRGPGGSASAPGAGSRLEPSDGDFTRGALPGKNYQTGVMPGWPESRSRQARRLAREYVTKTGDVCYACSKMPCFDIVEVIEGKYAGTRVGGGTRSDFVMEFGARCAVDNMPAILKCKELCQRLGMDYVSASGSISFAMELYQRGILTAKDTDGLELRWGNEDAVIQLLQKIASRNGFGDILADGSVRAAQKIGHGADQYVMAIKGLEMMGPDPRSGNRGFVVGAITNPRGGDNIKNTHGNAAEYNPNWWVDRFDMFQDVKEKIYNMPPEAISETWDGKPMMIKWFEDLYSVINSLCVCFTPSGFRLAYGPTYLAKMLSACTGWDTTAQDVMRWGEKIFTLFKAYTVRQGLTRKDDTWPDRFFTEPLPEGPATGAVISKDDIKRLLDEYYELRGWDKERGIPTRQKLIDLGLSDLIG